MKANEKKIHYVALAQEGYSLPQPVESVKSGGNYVSYGKDNQYPQWLWELYEDTAIFQTLVNNLLDYICGDEILFAKSAAPASFDMTQGEIEDLVRKCALDAIVFNACSVQRIRNKARQLVKLAYLDQVKVRYDIGATKIYYCNDWKKKDNVIELPVNDDTVESDAVTFRAIGKSVYPIPLYNGALKAIVTANKIDTYHINNLSNSFASSCLINFNNSVPDDDTKNSIESALRSKFAGEENAGKFIVSWNDDKDHEATIVTLDSNDFDEKYKALRQNCEQNIVVAFRCPAQLLGYSSQTTTFNTIEYVAAFDLYNRTMVKPMQRRLLKFFNEALGGSATVNIAPYVIKFDTSDYDSNKPLQQ